MSATVPTEMPSYVMRFVLEDLIEAMAAIPQEKGSLARTLIRRSIISLMEFSTQDVKLEQVS